MKKNIFVSVFVLLISVMSFWACDPYKNFSMQLSEESIVLDIDTDDDGNSVYQSQELSVTISGGSKGVDKTIELPSSSVAKFEKLSEDAGVTVLKVTAVKEGQDDVVISSKEGGLSKKLHLNVRKTVKNISFRDSNIAIQLGGELDFSANGSAYLGFYPLDTTQKNVTYRVIEQEEKSGYAYFEGSVLHSNPLPADGTEIYPVASGRRYITIEAESVDNPNLKAQMTVYVVEVASTQLIQMNTPNDDVDSEDAVVLMPNADGEYEIVLTPESIGGIAVENAYYSHRVVSIKIGANSVEHSNYFVNTSLMEAQNSNLNLDALGFEYDQSSSGYGFRFVLTGITPGVVRKTVYVDHKTYVGSFTKAYTFVVKTINVPLNTIATVNGVNIAEYTSENPYVVFNGYVNSSFSDTTPFVFGNPYIDSSLGYTVAFSAEDNRLDLLTINNVDVIKTSQLVNNMQTLYIKHNYTNTTDTVYLLTFTYSFSFCPSNGTVDEYETFSVNYRLPLMFKRGVSEEDIASLGVRYYINSSMTEPKTLLELPGLIASEQVERIETNNDRVTFIFEDNLIKVVSSSMDNNDLTIAKIYFANGRVSKEMLFTTYIPLAYDNENELQLTIDKTKVLLMGELVLNDENEVSYTSLIDSVVEVDDTFSYTTFTNVIVPTNMSEGIELNVWNIYNTGVWNSVIANNMVTAVAENSNYFTWRNGRLYTYSLATTSLRDNLPAPVALELAISGYEYSESITEREEKVITHKINVWVFDRLGGLNLQLLRGTELKDFNSVGSVLSSTLSIYEPGLVTVPARDNLDVFGVTTLDFNLLEEDENKVVKTYSYFDDYGVQRNIDVTMSDILTISDGVITAGISEALLNQICNAIGSTAESVLNDLYGDGITCRILGRASQFGKMYYDDSYVVVSAGQKVTKLVFAGISDSGVYFEYKNNTLDKNYVDFGYTVFPTNATTKEVRLSLEFAESATGKPEDYYSATVNYNAGGGVVRVTLLGDPATTVYPKINLVINPLDNYRKDVDGQDVVYNERFVSRVLISLGNGTQSSKFQIRSIEDLQKALSDTESYYYEFANDIDASGYTLNFNNSFKGNLDGQFGQSGKYYAVTGLNIVQTIKTAGNYNFGLFGTVAYNAQIHNLNIDNAKITVKVDSSVNAGVFTLNVGLLAGTLYGNVYNSRVSGIIDVTNAGTFGSLNVGGMVGLMSHHSVSGEDKSAHIAGKYLGYNSNNTANTDINISVITNANGANNAGGLVGSVTLANTNINVKDVDDVVVLSAISVVDSSNNSVEANLGGVAGHGVNLNVYNTNVVANIFGYDVGGVIGKAYNGVINHVSVEFRYSDVIDATNSIVATNILGGLVGLAEEKQTPTDGELQSGYLNIKYSYVRSYTLREINADYIGALVLNSTSAGYLGGLIGLDRVETFIDSSYVDADIHAVGDYASDSYVAGFVGNNTKVLNISYSYAKGRMVVDDGTFALVSGSETNNSTVTTGSINDISYFVSGSLSDYYVQNYGDTASFNLNISQIDTVSYREVTVNLSNAEIYSSYIAFNDQVYSIVPDISYNGGNAYTEIKYRSSTINNKKLLTTSVDYVGSYEATVEGELHNFYVYAMQLTRTKITQDSLGTTNVVDRYESVVDFNSLPRISQKYLYYKYNPNNVITIDYDENFDELYSINSDSSNISVPYYFYTIEIPNSDDSEVPSFVHAMSENNSDPQTDEERWNSGGFYVDANNEIKFNDFEYTDYNNVTIEVNALNAIRQLIKLYNQPYNQITAYSLDYQSLTEENMYEQLNIQLFDLLSGIMQATNFTIVQVSNSDEVTHISFAEIFGSRDKDNYNYFSAYLGDITSGEANINVNLFGNSLIVNDTKNNPVFSGTINPLNGTLVNSYKWVVNDKINGGMPVIIEYNSGARVESGAVLYNALYSSMPKFDGTTIEYSLTPAQAQEHVGLAQEYYVLSDISLMLLAGNTYEITETNKTNDTNYQDVININISQSQFDPISYFALNNMYFVKLLSNDAHAFVSSNPNVVMVTPSNRLVAQAPGVATITMYSLYDENVYITFQVTVVDSFAMLDVDHNPQVFVDVETNISMELKNEEYSVVPAGFMFTFANPGDEVVEINNIASNDQENYVLDMTTFKVKGVNMGSETIVVTPFIEVGADTIGAKEIVVDGVSHYVVLLSDIQTTLLFDVIQRAKSIDIVGQTSAAGTPDSVVELYLVIKSYTPNQELEFPLVDLYINDSLVAQGVALDDLANYDPSYHSKYLLDVEYELMLSDGLVPSEVIDNVTIYTYTYKITMYMSSIKYYASINRNASYQNPLSNSIKYQFVFTPSTNNTISRQFQYTLKPNDLTKFDVNYYPNGEYDNGNSFKPTEVKSTKVVPGKTGMLKITPQRAFSAFNYIEVVALDYPNDIYLTQVQLNNNDGYSDLRYSATIVTNGIRLWNISYMDGSNVYFGSTYYVKLSTPQTLVQGQTLRLQITAYNSMGNVLYSQIVSFTTEYLPQITSAIVNDNGEAVKHTEVSVGAEAQVNVVASNLDGAFSYNISDIAPANQEEVYLATFDAETNSYVKVEKNTPNLTNGTQYYVVVTENYDLLAKNALGNLSNKITIIFFGNREVGGALESAQSSIGVQVVGPKISAVSLAGVSHENDGDILVMLTGERTGLYVNISGGNQGDKDYFAGISKLFSGRLPYGTRSGVNQYYNPFGWLNSEGTAIGLNSGDNGGANSQFKFSLISDETVRYYSIQAITTGSVTLRIAFRYYFNDAGEITVYDDFAGAEILANYNVYEIVYTCTLEIYDGSTEDAPITISTEDEFVEMLNNSEGDYILTNDIELTNWEPTAINVDSLDGNGFRVFIKSFDLQNLASTANVGLFTTVGSNNTSTGVVTTIKNLALDLSRYESVINGVATIDFTNIRKYNESTGENDRIDVTNLTFGMFAAVNNGCITNCSVINTNNEIHDFVVNTRQIAEGTVSFFAQVAGFVSQNSGTISNSFVGKAYDGNIKLAVTSDGNQQLKDFNTYAFDIHAGQQLGGFVYSNSGIISNSYTKGLGLVNLSQKASNSKLAGFVVNNVGKIYSCFTESEYIQNFRPNRINTYGWQLQSVGTTAGFVHDNSGVIDNAYSKMYIKVNSVNTAGFAYASTGTIRNAYTTTININNTSSSSDNGSYAHSPFISSAWDNNGNKQYGVLEHCYYLNLDDELHINQGSNSVDKSIILSIDPATPISATSFDGGTGASNFQKKESFEGFNIVEGETLSNDYIWYLNVSQSSASDYKGPELVGAIQETVSNRVFEGVETTEDGADYNKFSWQEGYNIGSSANPIVVNTAENLIKNIVQYSRVFDTGKEKLYVFGGSYGGGDVLSSTYSTTTDVLSPSYIRIVNNINLTDSSLNTPYLVRGNRYSVRLCDIIFMGYISGNGMTLSGIKLTESSSAGVENYGLFNQIGLSDAQLNTDLGGITLGGYMTGSPKIFNTNFVYTEVSHPSAKKVGVLAGSMYNATLRMVSLSGPKVDASDNISKIYGQNLVGGLAGLIEGNNTNMYDVTLTNIRVVANKNNIHVSVDHINNDGYYTKWEEPNATSASVVQEAKLIKIADNSISNLDEISYAGTVAGAIRVNNFGTISLTKDGSTTTQTLAQTSHTDFGFVDVSPNANANIFRRDSSVSNITVTGVIDVSADNAGGMFGYIGNNTIILDSAVVLDQDAYQNIYGYNFSGGIVAEMHDSVLERVQVKHTQAVQDAIDLAINKATPATIGSQDLFKSSDYRLANSVSVAIGGIAGYSEHSAIVDSYSKINVTNADAKLAGGLIGYAKAFNYLGFVYTTGAVLAKEVVGGLVGFYTYNDYSLYLNEAFALNRWGVEIKSKLISVNNEIQNVMPEIGNTTYNNHVTGDVVEYNAYVGSVVGKMTLLPGSNGSDYGFDFLDLTKQVLNLTQRVLDKSYWYNDYNYNVISTTYSVLSESSTALETRMYYTDASLVLNNDDMDTLYAGNNSELQNNSHKAYIGDQNTIKFDSILGKQTYLEMITGYFFSNEDGGYNYGSYTFNNEFDTRYGFTKSLTDDSFEPSKIWYKNIGSEYVFPEYLYGKEAVVNVISDSNTLTDAFANSSDGQYYILAPSADNVIELNISTTNSNGFNMPFSGIIQGKLDNSGNKPTIKISWNDTNIVPLLRSLVNAEFVNVNFEFVVTEDAGDTAIDVTCMADNNTTSDIMQSYGMLARYIQNCSFTNCSFVVSSTRSINYKFSGLEEATSYITNFGLIFGLANGATFKNSSLDINPAVNVYLDYNTVSDYGNYAMFIGKAMMCNVSDFSFGATSILYNITSLNGDKNHTPNTNLNLGAVFGWLNNNSKLSDVHVTLTAYNIINTSNVFEISNKTYVSGGIVAGCMNNVNAQSVTVSCPDITYNINKNSAIGYVTLGGFAGFAQNAYLQNMQLYDKSTLNITLKYFSQAHVGGLIGLLDKSTLSGGVYAISCDINVTSMDNVGAMYLGGIVGSVGSLAGASGEPFVEISNYSTLNSVSGYNHIGNITYSLSADRNYVGGLVGYAKQAHVFNNSHLGDILAESSNNTTTYIGGLVGMMHLPTDGEFSKFGDNLASGHIKFTDNTNTFVGGLVGSFKTTSDRLENVGKNYAYCFLDYTIKSSDISYSIQSDDVICPTTLGILGNSVYISELMPYRANNYGTEYGYEDWYISYKSNNKGFLSSALFKPDSALIDDVENYLEQSGSLFNPHTSLDTLTKAEADKVYLLNSVSHLYDNENPNIIKRALIVGTTVHNNIANSSNLLSQVKHNVAFTIKAESSHQITNNAIISGMDFVYTRDSEISMFGTNYGTIYNCTVYGNIESISVGFAPLGVSNYGTMENLNVSTTVLSDVNRNYAGVVLNNYGQINMVSCTSGALSVDSYVGNSYQPIAITSPGIITNCIFGGIMPISSSVVGGSGVKIVDANNFAETIEYNGQYGNGSNDYIVFTDYNFDVPSIASTSLIPTKGKTTGTYRDLYATTGDTTYIRSIFDIVRTNTSIDCGGANTVNSGSGNTHTLGVSAISAITNRYIHKLAMHNPTIFEFTSDITLRTGDFEKFGDKLTFNANRIDGENKTFDAHNETYTIGLADALSGLNDLTIKNLKLATSDDAYVFGEVRALKGEVWALKNVTFNNISVVTNSNNANVGLINTLTGSSENLKATNISLGASSSVKSLSYIGVISNSTNKVSTITNSNISNVTINDNGLASEIEFAGALVGFGENSIGYSPCSINIGEITNVIIKNAKSYVGGVAGEFESLDGLTVKDVSITVPKLEAGAYIGGVVGEAGNVYNTTLTTTDNETTGSFKTNHPYVLDCTLAQSGTINSSSETVNYYVGGIAGDADVNSSVRIIDSDISISNVPYYKDETPYSINENGDKTTAELMGITNSDMFDKNNASKKSSAFDIQYKYTNGDWRTPGDTVNDRTVTVSGTGNLLKVYPINKIGVSIISHGVIPTNSQITNSYVQLSQTQANNRYAGVALSLKLEKATTKPQEGQENLPTGMENYGGKDWSLGYNRISQSSLVVYDSDNNGIDVVQKLSLMLVTSYSVRFSQNFAGEYYVDEEEKERMTNDGTSYQEELGTHSFWGYVEKNDIIFERDNSVYTVVYQKDVVNQVAKYYTKANQSYYSEELDSFVNFLKNQWVSKEEIGDLSNEEIEKQFNSCSWTYVSGYYVNEGTGSTYSFPNKNKIAYFSKSQFGELTGKVQYSYNFYLYKPNYPQTGVYLTDVANSLRRALYSSTKGDERGTTLTTAKWTESWTYQGFRITK